VYKSFTVLLKKQLTTKKSIDEMKRENAAENAPELPEPDW